jgi:hypothetical protein
MEVSQWGQSAEALQEGCYDVEWCLREATVITNMSSTFLNTQRNFSASAQYILPPYQLSQMSNLFQLYSDPPYRDAIFDAPQSTQLYVIVFSQHLLMPCVSYFLCYCPSISLRDFSSVRIRTGHFDFLPYSQCQGMNSNPGSFLFRPLHDSVRKRVLSWVPRHYQSDQCKSLLLKPVFEFQILHFSHSFSLWSCELL